MNIGPYEVLDPVADKLGESGMGIVYRAVQRSLRRTVAIKVPKDECLRDPSLVERFKREAESAANMQDPNIVTVYEASLHEPPYFYAMEFLSGGTLKQFVDTKRPSPADLLPAFKALCHGLDAAHARGIVHRDIKPDNLMADERGRWKITDFGIAKDLEGTSAGTSTGAQFGTIPYMSPEQIEDSSQVDWRSDIYSAGATIYHALAGRPAFEGGLVTIMRNVTQGKFEPLASVRPDLKHLDGIVRKAMALRREQRYQSCGELYADLEKAVTSGRAVVAHAPTPQATPEPVNVGPQPPAPPRERRFPLVPAAISAVAVLLILVAVMVVMRVGPPGSRTTTPAPRTTTPAPRATTPAPRATTPAPRATTPAPRATTPAPRATTPAPRATTPAPRATTPAPGNDGDTGRTIPDGDSRRSAPQVAPASTPGTGRPASD